eukprot:scaffold186438_cov24-Tisochrysis_lutea.AAC.1
MATSMLCMLSKNPQWNAPVNIYATSVKTIDFLMANLVSNTAFNSPVTIESRSALTTIGYAFSKLSAWNSPLRITDTSGVTAMYATFSGANAFNQP